MHEAVALLHTHLSRCRAAGVRRSLIVTGRGVHSDGGVAKIRPAVEEALRAERGIRVKREGEGAVLVEFIGTGAGTGGGTGVGAAVVTGVVGVVGSVVRGVWGWVRK